MKKKHGRGGEKIKEGMEVEKQGAKEGRMGKNGGKRRG